MADFIFNIGKGRIGELANRVANNDPANSAFVWVAVVTTEADGTLQDLDDLAAVIANVNTAEATNGGYARVTQTDAVVVAPTPDDTNNWLQVDLPDVDFGAISAGDNWTDLLLCYDDDTAAGTDANIVPLIQFDFPITTDGTNVTAEINVNGVSRHQ